MTFPQNIILPREYSKEKVSPLFVLEILIMISSTALLLSWPLDHTIALRNISLILGFCSSIIWTLLVRPKFTWLNLVPVVLLLCVPLWLLVKLLFFPTAPRIQLAELGSLWFRVTMAVPLAYVCGMLMVRRPFFVKALIAIACIYPAMPILMQLYTQFLSDILRPTPAYIFKTKVSGVYWLMWSCSLGYALLHFLFLLDDSHQKKWQIKQWLIFVIAGSLIVFSLIDFFLLGALNGLLIGSAAGFVLICLFLYKTLFAGKFKYSKLLLLALITVGGGILAIGATYKNLSPGFNNKLAPLFSDIKASLDIDKTKTWQRGDQVRDLPHPTNEKGAPINVSTYERTSWLIKGASVLLENPLGTGYTSGAFHRYMVQEYPGSTVQMTHCGWLDMALGVGLPGLIFLILAIASILFSAYRAPKTAQCSLNIATLWMLGSMVALWLPAELAEREYIESLFYMAALFSGAQVKLSE